MRPLKTGITLLISVICLISACRKDDETNPSDFNYSEYIKTTVYGQITYEDGSPAANKKVYCEGLTTITNSHGLYAFNQISVRGKRFTVSTDFGYFKTARPERDRHSICNIQIRKDNNALNLDADNGGTVNHPSGVSIAFPPNGIIDINNQPYSGNVLVYVDYFDPSDKSYYKFNPVHDHFIADRYNRKKSAFSFGTVKVELYSPAGQKLNLDPLSPALLRIPAASPLSTAPPQTADLAFADPESGQWIIEGTATLTGSVYEAEVSHFSWWGAVTPLGSATIHGNVKDINNHIIPGAYVFETYSGYPVQTNSNGHYTMDLWEGYSYLIEAPASINMFSGSNQISTPNLVSGNIYNLADIVLSDATLINGSTTNCSNQAMNSFVIAFDSISGSYLYTYSGNQFTLFAGINKTVQLIGLQFNESASIYHTAGASGTISVVGNFQVCSTVNATGTITITLNTPQTGIVTSTLNQAYGSLYSLSLQGWMVFHLSSLDSLGFGFLDYMVEFDLPLHMSYIPGPMSWEVPDTTSGLSYNPLSFLGAAYVDPGNNFYFEGFNDYTFSGGVTTITQIGPVGGTISGSFSGPVNIYETGVWTQPTLTGTIDCTFNVPRIY